MRRILFRLCLNAGILCADGKVQDSFWELLELRVRHSQMYRHLFPQSIKRMAAIGLIACKGGNLAPKLPILIPLLGALNVSAPSSTKSFMSDTNVAYR